MIDVSKCNYYDNGFCDSNRTTFAGCEYNNCYFKQYGYMREINEKNKQKLEKIKEYCNEQNLKADYTACEVLRIIEGEE